MCLAAGGAAALPSRRLASTSLACGGALVRRRRRRARVRLSQRICTRSPADMHGSAGCTCAYVQGTHVRACHAHTCTRSSADMHGSAGCTCAYMHGVHVRACHTHTSAKRKTALAVASEPMRWMCPCRSPRAAYLRRSRGHHEVIKVQPRRNRQTINRRSSARAGRRGRRTRAAGRWHQHAISVSSSCHSHAISTSSARHRRRTRAAGRCRPCT